jgi:hypothetical protein
VVASRKTSEGWSLQKATVLEEAMFSSPPSK